MSFTQCLPSSANSQRWKQRLLSRSLVRPLDRVNVLGDDTHGHSGCVNALSWAQDGQLLLSGGDDTTVRVWRMDISDTAKQYPFVCQSVIHTGHRANIFNAHMLPYSTRMQVATVAGDNQVRVFDMGDVIRRSPSGLEVGYHCNQAYGRVLRCHTDRVKRIVTEHSPDLFLTVAEDGHVRQHDLRARHTCSSGCPAPLVKMGHELSALALSPLSPHHFVVAGDSPYGYLFDRRYAGRFLQEEWGLVPAPGESDLATCVRRFGRQSANSGGRRRREHITGAKVSASNGHEVLLSYSSEGVHLFSTKDEPSTPEDSRSCLLVPNSKRRKIAPATLTSNILVQHDKQAVEDTDMSLSQDVELGADGHGRLDEEDDEEDDDDDEDDEDLEGINQLEPQSHRPKVPVILPRAIFTGHRNVETVKDVNFVGPYDEFVASGSDDGNFFLWNKATEKLHDILEGDGSVVNVIEPHPHLPLIAVSGIDTTVKLFAPVNETSTFSRMRAAEDIVRHNQRPVINSRMDITNLLLSHGLAFMSTSPDREALQSQCTHQ